MNPDDFFNAVEHHQAGTSPFLARAYGIGVRELSQAEANRAVRNAGAAQATDMRPTGYCHDCGVPVSPRRLFCDTHKLERRKATHARHQRNWSHRRADKGEYGHCLDCGVPLSRKGAKRCKKHANAARGWGGTKRGWTE